MVILKKDLSRRTYRFLSAAELIGGGGHGWATRFVAVVAAAGTPSPGSATPPPFPPLSVSRMHNLLNGYREVTPALESIITRLAETSAVRMEANAAKLRQLCSDIENDPHEG